jgi:hypothetical protein
MSDRHERPKKRRRQGTENFLAEDILKYFEAREFSVTPHTAAYSASQ